MASSASNDPFASRKADTIDIKKDQEKQKPVCVLLPSPELLSCTRGSRGSDDSNTLKDFYDFYEWAKANENLQLLEFTGMRETLDSHQELEENVYDAMIDTAFNLAFDPIRNTLQADQPQLVIWYYAGHGDNNGRINLHHHGHRDLHAIINPWIDAVNADSTNARGQIKSNKHLVIILDCCYSGKLADDLTQIALTDGPWKTHKGCSVTVQAACKANETVPGRYFTPVFLNLNTNRDRLQRLLTEWNQLAPDAKNAYNDVPDASPKMATTHPFDGPLLEFPQQHFSLCLFPDPRFFKFCKAKA